MKAYRKAFVVVGGKVLSVRGKIGPKKVSVKKKGYLIEAELELYTILV